MSTRDTPFAPGTPCWVDLLTTDYDRSSAFYGTLFGWTFSEATDEFGNYVTCSSDGYPVAGMMRQRPDSSTPDLWSTYLATADIDATVAAAQAAGGTTLTPAMAIGDIGTMAMLGDTAGGTFGLWQAGTHTGFNKYNEPGAVTWDEYHSKDFAASKSFYGSVFGVGFDMVGDTDEFRYATLTVNGDMVAGMMDSVGFLPAEVPSMWAVYFSVANADEAQDRAAKLGATVLRTAEDTPYGRIADLADVTGANFRLHQTLLET
jgi:uncharacterized protein